MNSTPALLPADAPWIVIKFGGTSVSTRPRWDTIARIAGTHRKQGKRVLIVVSALSGITDQLKAIGEACADAARCRAFYVGIVERHHALFDDLELRSRNALDGWLARLDQLLGDPRRPAGVLSWQAELLAHGELLSSTLGALYLNATDLATHWIDSRDHFRCEALPNQSEWGRWLSASVEARPDPAAAAALAARGDVFIAQGFIARNAEGMTTVLGRGGSDTSAAYYGALLSAEAVEIWTDVPGMFSANPRQVPDARLLSRLDYAEAQEIATTGAKVLHPRCIHPLRETRVPLRIKDTNRPDLPGTAIGWSTVQTAPSVKAISSRKGITLVSMESISMWQQVGFLSDVFAAFKAHGLSVDLIGSAETNVTVSLDPSDNLLNSDVLARLCADLEQFCRVKVIAPCAAITMVGRGMRAMLHKLSAVLAEFGALDVHLISQSSNNLNLTFVVEEGLADTLIPRLHALLIRAEAMRVDDGAVFGPSWRELAEGAATAAPAAWWRRRRTALLELAAAGTPRYAYDLDQVRTQARGLTALGAVDRWHYALKANPQADILRTLHAEGFAFECVSFAEVEHVRRTLPDLAPERILFTPNFAPREEYRAGLAAGVRVTLDALHPITEWGADFAGHDILLRVDLGSGRGHHDKVKTGGAQSKFGVALDEIETFREHARRHGARIVGLHAHLGSGILDAGHWRGVCAQMASLAERFNRIEILDLGGGLGVPSRPEDVPLDLAELGAALAEVQRAYPQFRLWMEPGRYLVAEAGVLLARVTQVKRKGEVHYVGIDTGMNSLIRPALYEAWHAIVNLSRLDEPPTDLVQVVGPICETGDVLGHNRRLPPCREGDVILIAEAGAYGAAMGSRYNLREPAAEVVV
ncbi:bifunctional aspartate kinase/diaminopimelate decarboxylase [Dokdonella koreensis]|uniref:Diaminopimelate decarboxylase n=1 Tax=Dokdonella koreensis DS-123 TaxID=1300342 RepID=A0A160DS33_9GAMM|nr:bifunctional aspartate kinase/diaminopimelate decarboxylase [Dokdonella koreensis]ANB16854.1 Bifunctional aspartate kinase/diaminopimelate decarboxylase protein [Dokdonella koreensis DS-123]